MKTTIFGMLLILAVPILGFGQDKTASWQELQRLKAGNTIRVIQKNAPDIQGKFLRFSAEEVFVEVGKKEMSVGRAVVQRIDVKKRSKRILHALLGAGAGAAAGLAVFAGANSEDAFYGTALPLFPVLVGAGTVTGALLPGYSTIYKAP